MPQKFKFRSTFGLKPVLKSCKISGFTFFSSLKIQWYKEVQVIMIISPKGQGRERVTFILFIKVLLKERWMSRCQKGSLLAVSVFHPFGVGHQRARLPMMGGNKKEGFFFLRCFKMWTTFKIFIEFYYNIASVLCFGFGPEASGASQMALVVKNPPGNAGDWVLIPGSGRSPGGGNDTPLQYSCLENPLDRGA